MRRKLISNALKERFRELCGERTRHFAPERFGEMASFVSAVREQLAAASPASLNGSTSNMSAPSGWNVSDRDCLSSLRALSAGEPLRLQHAPHPPVEAFIPALDASRDDSLRRFQLLTERYSCPLNFSSPAEDAARERVLARLMAIDRARIENNSIEAIEGADLLLRLNLVALHAARVPDLRFLDALNYYYELLPIGWQPQTQHGWLLISYFALYARALAAWIREDN